MTKAATPERPVHRPTSRVRIERFEDGRRTETQDIVVREEPLEIRLRDAAGERRLGIIMRTPGADEELALGFLFGEGILHSAQEVAGMSWEPSAGDAQEYNSLRVDLAPGVRVDWARLERPFLTSSACGVCGRAVLDSLPAPSQPREDGFRLPAARLHALPALLRARQEVFSKTGALHAAALVDETGGLLELREDVGRHNAVDKLIGAMLRREPTRLAQSALLVSGRAGYEIVAKAARAGIPLVAAVGAPSSLAVDVAKKFHLTLVGFLREDRFNVYASPHRLA